MPEEKKNILIVAESINVDDSSGSKASVALIKNLNAAGFEINVYHYTRKKIKLEGIPCVSIEENRHSLLFFLSRIERQIRYRTGWKLNKYIEQLFGFSFTLFNDRNSIVTSLRKITKFKPDLVLTLSKGGSFRPHHALLKIPEWHSKWMAYIHDPYPFAYYPRPYDWVEPGHQRKWQLIQDISKNAEFCAFPSKLLLEWMGSYFPNFIKNGIVIPHQISYNKISKDFPDFFNPEEFNILHAGTLLNFRKPEGLINGFFKFLRNVPEAKKDSKLLLLGNSHLRDDIADYNNYNFYFSAENFSFTSVQKMQKSTALNVILEAKSEISPFLPGKFPHCVEANKPILLLGPKLSESKRLLGEDYPYWTEIDNEDKIAQILEILYFKWKVSPKEFNLNRNDLVEYLSVPFLKSQFVEILTN